MVRLKCSIILKEYLCMSLAMNIMYECISNNSEIAIYLCYFYYNQLMHNHLIKVYITIVFCVIYTPICFDTFVSSSGSYNQCLAQLHMFWATTTTTTTTITTSTTTTTTTLCIAVVDNIIIKLRCFAPSLYKFSECIRWDHTFFKLLKC